MKTTILLISIALDLGDKKHALCVLNQDGDIIDERTITNRNKVSSDDASLLDSRHWFNVFSASDRLKP